MKRPAREGDRRAEHAFASASTNAMHEFVHDPHGLRCAVQARCNSCLVSRGDAPVGPAGPDAPPSPLPHRLRPLGAQRRGQSFFFLGSQTIKFLQSKFFSHENRSGFARSYLAPASDLGRRGHPIVAV